MTKVAARGRGGAGQEANADKAKPCIEEARVLIAAMPVSEEQAASAELRGAFTGGKEKGARQAEIENQWAGFARDQLREGEGQG